MPTSNEARLARSMFRSLKNRSLLALALALPLALGACSGVGSLQLGFDTEGGSGYVGDGDGDGDGDDAGDGDGDDGSIACEADLPVAEPLDVDQPLDMADPVRVRTLIASNASVEEGLRRIGLDPQAFLNYYDFAYPRPELDLGAHLQLWHAPLDPQGRWTLQAAVVAPEVGDVLERPAMHFTFVLDAATAGKTRDRLEASATALVSALEAGDLVTVIAPGLPDPKRLLDHEVSGASDPTVLDAVLGLPTDSATNVDGGVSLAYDLATTATLPAGTPRHVVVITERDVEDLQGLSELVDTDDAAVVTQRLTTVHVGALDAAPANLEQLGLAGSGNTLFVSDGAEAWDTLYGRFDELFVAAAYGLSVTLELPPGFEVLRGPLPGTGSEVPRPGTKGPGAKASTEPRQPLSTEARHAILGAGDTLVFTQAIETCAFDLLDDDAAAILHVSWIDPSQGDVRELEVTAPLLAGPDAAQSPDVALLLHKARVVRRYAEGLAAWREAPLAERAAIVDEIVDEVAAVEGAMPGDEDLLEILDVLATLVEA